MMPYYFSDLTSFHHTDRSVRSAYYLILTIPQPCFNFKANSALSIAALRLWISPRLSIRSSSTINMFKTNFNTHVVPLGFAHLCSPFVSCVAFCRTVQNWLFSNVVLYKYIWPDLKSIYFPVCSCIESQLRGQVCNANTCKERISLTAQRYSLQNDVSCVLQALACFCNTHWQRCLFHFAFFRWWCYKCNCKTSVKAVAVIVRQREENKRYSHHAAVTCSLTAILMRQQ